MAAKFKQCDRIDEAQYFEVVSAIEDSVTRLCGLDAEILKEVERDQRFDVHCFTDRTSGASGATSAPERELPGFCRSGFEQSSDLYRYCISKRVPPSDAIQQLNISGEIEDETIRWFADTVLSYALGASLGRWDIRYARGDKVAPELLDPFAPLPVCPPGQLQNAQGLPARREDVPAAYPLESVAWDGILVDDEGDEGQKRDIITQSERSSK